MIRLSVVKGMIDQALASPAIEAKDTNLKLAQLLLAQIIKELVDVPRSETVKNTCGEDPHEKIP